MRVITKALENNESFRNHLLDCDLISLQECTDEENEQFLAMVQANKALPDGVMASQDDSAKFVQIIPADLTPGDELNMIEYLKLTELKKIGNWVTFFGILTVVSLIVGLIIHLVK